MFSIILLILFINVVNSRSTCYGNPVPSCSVLQTFTQCFNSYGFLYDLSTAKPSTTIGNACFWQVSTGSCVTDWAYSAECTPKCDPPKKGGPAGWHCGNFTCADQCKALYADRSGSNRWCYWDTNTNLCKEYCVCA